MNNIKKAPKLSVINKNIKKNSRGTYQKISTEVRREIIRTLMYSRQSLSQISEHFKVNKETIRSFYKNLDHKNLYFNIERYFVQKYLHSQEFNIQQLEKEQISKLIKQDIDHSENDQELEQVLKDIQKKREQSKTKNRTKPIIQFNSKNRRIINKIVSFIQLAVAAAKKYTDSIQINPKVQNEFYDSFIYDYLTYDPYFSNCLYMSHSTSEQDSSYQSQLTETRPYFRDI